MFQRSEADLGSGGGAAVLSLDNALPAFQPFFAPGFGQATRPNPFDSIDFVPDLGANIGSLVWWRGLVTCITLCILTYALSPGLRSIPGYSPRAMSAAAWEDSRAQSIAPLAWGADSGHHMGATDAVQPLVGTPERPIMQLSSSIGQGDGLARALERAGVASSEAGKVTAMIGDVVDPGDIAAGTALAITLGRRPNPRVARPLEHLDLRARFDMRVAFDRNGGGLSMQRMPIAVDHTPLRITGRIDNGVYVSATAAGAPPGVVETYIKALAGKVSLDALDSDARYDMIVERERAATGDVRFGKLLYVGLDQGRRSLRMIEWKIGGQSQWYDAAGVGAPHSEYTMPVAGARKTSGFGMRMHPLLGYSRMHQGVDYGAVYGTPIQAATSGVVTFAGWHGGHGNMVKLAHAGGLGTGYAHMSRIAVSPGARVSQGQVIGYVGSTGLSTGPHLHFEVYRSGVPVNPSSVNFAAASLLSGPELANFKSRLHQITSIAAN